MLTNHYNVNLCKWELDKHNNKKERLLYHTYSQFPRVFLKRQAHRTVVPSRRLWFPQLRFACLYLLKTLFQILDLEWLPRPFTAERGAGALLLQSDTSISPGSPCICPTMEIHPSNIQRFNPPMNIINCSMERRKEKLRWGRTYRQTNTTDKLLQM